MFINPFLSSLNYRRSVPYHVRYRIFPNAKQRTSHPF
jgi:hypothetical protein